MYEQENKQLCMIVCMTEKLLMNHNQVLYKIKFMNNKSLCFLLLPLGFRFKEL